MTLLDSFKDIVGNRPLASQMFWFGDIAYSCQYDPCIEKPLLAFMQQHLPVSAHATALAQFHLRVVVDDTLFSTISQLLSESKPELYEEVMADDLKYGVYHTIGGSWYRLLRDNDHDNIHDHIINKRSDGIDILVHRETRYLNNYLFRVMREIMLRSYENTNGFLFHASAAAFRGKGLIFCGSSVSGKTTTMTLCLRHADGQLLANDRVVIVPSDPLQVVAIPMSVRTGAGTVKYISDLSTFITHNSLSRPQTKPQILLDTGTDFGSRKKIEFTPAEYTRALGTSFIAFSRLDAIIFPSMTNDARPFWHQTISALRASTLLRESCYTPHDTTFNPWLIKRRLSDEELLHRADELCIHLASTYPAVELGFGVQQPVQQIELSLKSLLADIVGITE